MPKKKREYMNVWEWLLDMGLLKATALFNLITSVCLVVTMAVLNWLLEK